MLQAKIQGWDAPHDTRVQFQVHFRPLTQSAHGFQTYVLCGFMWGRGKKLHHSFGMGVDLEDLELLCMNLYV